MTSEERKKIFEILGEKMVSITASKAHDYAGEDVLKNFKSVSGAAKSLGLDTNTPTGYALFMVTLKMARIANLIEGEKQPNNEAIDDSFIDGIIYFMLAYCCYLDENKV